MSRKNIIWMCALISLVAVLAQDIDLNGNGLIDAGDLAALHSFQAYLLSQNVSVDTCKVMGLNQAFCESIDLDGDSNITWKEITFIKSNLFGTGKIVSNRALKNTFNDTLNISKCKNKTFPQRYVDPTNFCKLLDLDDDENVTTNEARVFNANLFSSIINLTNDGHNITVEECNYTAKFNQTSSYPGWYYNLCQTLDFDKDGIIENDDLINFNKSLEDFMSGKTISADQCRVNDTVCLKLTQEGDVSFQETQNLENEAILNFGNQISTSTQTNPPSTGGGGGGGHAACRTNWVCFEWTSCKDGEQTRYCYDRNRCDEDNWKRIETRTCTVEETPEQEQTQEQQETQESSEETIQPPATTGAVVGGQERSYYWLLGLGVVIVAIGIAAWAFKRKK